MAAAVPRCPLVWSGRQWWQPYRAPYDLPDTGLRMFSVSTMGFWLSALGQVYAQQGRFAEAIAAQQKARERWGLVLVTAELARVYALAGRTAEARQALADLLAGAKHQLGVHVYDRDSLRRDGGQGAGLGPTGAGV